MSSEEFHSRYRGFDIYRKTVTGYYVTFILGIGQLVADTLEGIRESIREQLNKSSGK